MFLCLSKQIPPMLIARTGRLNQTEFSNIIDPIITSPLGDREHLHNQLLAAVYANVTREMPDPGLAPWVSANDKPTVGAGSKPVSGDAAERRLKGEVMQLLSRDRRRIKDLVQNEVRYEIPGGDHATSTRGSVLTQLVTGRCKLLARRPLHRASSQNQTATTSRTRERPKHWAQHE